MHRELIAELGAGPLSLARAQRARTARTLLESTSLPIIDVATAAGFTSVRQLRATIRDAFAATPSDLRGRARRRIGQSAEDAIVMRLASRAPSGAVELLSFLGVRAIAGVEEVLDGEYRRSLRLPHGAGVVALRPADGHVQARFWLDDLRDLTAALQRTRALMDLDCDPAAVLEALGSDRVIGALVNATPGRRVPGHVDGHELAIRAVLGQQVSVAGAVTLAGRLVVDYGEPLVRPLGGVSHLFPSAAALAQADPQRLAMPGARRRALIGLARTLARNEIALDGGADREEVQAQLQALPGLGPWTVSYIAMRALRDPDAFLASDLGVRKALERLGHAGDPKAATRLAEPWRPYRAYAVQHLWASLSASATRNAPLAA